MTIHSVEKNVQSPEWFLARSLLGSSVISWYGRGVKFSTAMNSIVATKWDRHSKHRQEEEYYLAPKAFKSMNRK